MSQIYPCINVTIWQTATGPDDVVRFEGAWAGLSAIGSEWSKGIAYIPGDYKKEGPILPNLDKPGALPYGMYLRQIEPHWFIYYDYID